MIQVSAAKTLPTLTHASAPHGDAGRNRRREKTD